MAFTDYKALCTDPGALDSVKLETKSDSTVGDEIQTYFPIGTISYMEYGISYGLIEKDYPVDTKKLQDLKQLIHGNYGTLI